MVTSRLLVRGAIVSVATLVYLAPAPLASAAPTTAKPACARVPSDFNGDGFGDVATAAFGRQRPLVVDGGSVQVNYDGAHGVSGANAQYFDQETPGMPGPEADGDQFGASLAAGYFNDDCYADLAIGVPGEDNSNGAVIVLYGSASGLTTAGVQIFPGPDAAYLGVTLAAGDFNGDGYDDLAAGAPTDPDQGSDESGQVALYYGGSSGLRTPGSGTRAWIGQSTPGVPGAPEPGDNFGDSLAAGDFNRDGYADLAIGSPHEDDGTVVDAGAVTVVPGSASGLTGAGSRIFTQAKPGIPGINEKEDTFGAALAVGDVTGDGYADLVVGVPGESIGTVKNAGDIAFLPGGPGGITGVGTARFSEATHGVPGTVGTDDSAGSSLAVGDLTGDGQDEVIVGVPRDSTGAVHGGSVLVFPGSTVGPGKTGVRQITQGTPGVPGSDQDVALFGGAVATIYLHGGAHADLVVGARLYDTGSADADSNAGFAVVVPSTVGTGVTGAGSVRITDIGPDTTPNADFGSAFG